MCPEEVVSTSVECKGAVLPNERFRRSPGVPAEVRAGEGGAALLQRFCSPLGREVPTTAENGRLC